MARPREFDEAAAMDAAIDHFWHRGYEATSVRDLAACMGISSPSLYNSFGNKRELFALALERYLDAVGARADQAAARGVAAQTGRAAFHRGGHRALVE